MQRLSCKQMAHAWGISPTKATQARDPAFRKVALALIHYPVETMAELARYVTELDADLQQQFEDELPTRERMLNGTLDRQSLHPQR